MILLPTTNVANLVMAGICSCFWGSAMLEKFKKFMVSVPVLGRFLLFIKAMAIRYYRDRIMVEASHLAYVTLLSLVPLFTVLFSILSSMPVFNETKKQIQDFIFENFMPVSSELVSKNMEIFSNNASNTTLIGTLVLIIISMLLLDSINSSINHIWKCNLKRPFLSSLSTYWMVITLGPILISCSFALTSYAIALKFDGYGQGLVLFVQKYLLKVIPVMFSFVALFLMYVAFPVRKVNVSYAAIGAIVAAILLEVGKRFFSLYIIYFPSYQNIYGAIAVIPILLVWVYLSWLIVFIGVEIQASLQDVYDLKQKEAKIISEGGTVNFATEEQMLNVSMAENTDSQNTASFDKDNNPDDQEKQS